MKKLILPIVTMMLASCGGGGNQGAVTRGDDGRITIQMDEVEKRPMKIKISEMLKDIEVLQLDNDVVNSVDNILYMSDKYILATLNSRQQIKLFDSQSGKFIANIGTKGRGRGEYMTVYAFDIDEAAERIYVSNTNNINIYGFDGKFIDYLPVANKLRGIGMARIKVDTEAQEVTVFGLSTGKKILFKQNFEGKEICSVDGNIKENDYAATVFVGEYDNNEFWLYTFGSENPENELMRYDDVANKVDTTAVLTFRDYEEYKGTNEKVLTQMEKYGDYIIANSVVFNQRNAKLAPSVYINTKDLSYGKVTFEDDVLGIIKSPESGNIKGDYFTYPMPDPYKFFEDVDITLESDVSDEVAERLIDAVESIDEDGNMVVIRGRYR